MILADTEDSAPPAQEVDMSAPKPVNNARGHRQFRRRSLVSLDDIGQAAVPDSSMLFGLFFRRINLQQLRLTMPSSYNRLSWLVSIDREKQVSDVLLVY